MIRWKKRAKKNIKSMLHIKNFKNKRKNKKKQQNIKLILTFRKEMKL